MSRSVTAGKPKMVDSSLIVPLSEGTQRAFCCSLTKSRKPTDLTNRTVAHALFAGNQAGSSASIRPSRRRLSFAPPRVSSICRSRRSSGATGSRGRRPRRRGGATRRAPHAGRPRPPSTWRSPPRTTPAGPRPAAPPPATPSAGWPRCRRRRRPRAAPRPGRWRWACRTAPASWCTPPSAPGPWRRRRPPRCTAPSWRTR